MKLRAPILLGAALHVHNTSPLLRACSTCIVCFVKCAMISTELSFETLSWLMKFIGLKIQVKPASRNQ